MPTTVEVDRLPKELKRAHFLRLAARSSRARSKAAGNAAPSTSDGPTFEWRQCPDHPWLGVSVAVAGGSALCIRPLDGPNHLVEIQRTRPVPWAPWDVAA